MNIVNTSFIKKGDIIQFGHFPQSQSEETEFHAVGNNIYLDNKEKRVYKYFCENFSSKEDKYFYSGISEYHKQTYNFMDVKRSG